MQKIQFFGNTDIGKVSRNNEDAFIAQELWDMNHILGVVIDGVGGYEGGEVAARIAKDTIVNYLKKFCNGERLNLLKQAVTEANNKIVEEQEKQPNRFQMSCVLSACLVEVKKKQINIVHIGDTRAYCFHNGEMTKLSHDHSYVGYREDIGDLLEEEAMNHPKRNEINRMLGDKPHQTDDRDFLEEKTFPLLPNTILLLCSDGLTDLVTKAEMSSILSHEYSIKQKVQALIDLANNKGGKDNITVVLIEYLSDEIDNIENVNPVETERLKMKWIKSRKRKITKRRKIKKLWIVLIAILALFVGVFGVWLLNNS